MPQDKTVTQPTVGTSPQIRPNIVPRRLLATHERATLHPSVLAEAEHRAGSIQLRIADAITAFAGSMKFVYLHVVVFAAWMLFFQPNPWPTLTLIVSLEAIFLSTFVMIGQNRQASFQQAKADHDYAVSDRLLHENTDLTRSVHQLTQEIHQRILTGAGESTPVEETKPAKTSTAE